MKKQLLSTSALVAAGMIAATGTTGTAQAQQVVQAPASSPIQITVGGYMRQSIGFMDTNDVNGQGITTNKLASVRVASDTEIYFQGKTTLANGISVAVRVELEGNTSNDMIDESFASVEGAFGRLEMGSTDGVQAKTFISAPSPVYFGSVGSIGFWGGNTVRTAGGTTQQAGGVFAIHLGDEDAEKISYYTPRFEGFQLGLGYVPRASQDSNGGASLVINNDRHYIKGKQAGLNFTRAFGAIDVAASAGYMRWEKPVSATNDYATISDPSLYAFGLQVGYAGFRVGASYVRQKDLDPALTTNGASVAGTGSGTNANAGLNPGAQTPSLFVSHGHVWDVGGTYTFGPAVVGVNMVKSTSKDHVQLGLGDGEYEYYQLGGRYTLGPGVDVHAALFTYKTEGEQTNINQAGQDADNAKSTGLLIGLALTF